ncbi:UDP-N-acetylenolpyruvoylglucosamine reductase [Candidatus Uhrbacteria bacterium RIFCSPHIGHO2_12_FULL_60_25]|uniref:UDP-N-acetylenolpyruvoylglucosamine reductase n=1 Tax=Candidatus Uhrbacteria bacterium RIFCSPHIGHO2_12_FULL_60_25 TaxID=1802399 RepID=A0A1F7ULB2_9BACT|nr:MAG: UDP-N-acetylenolpyruvoylglucosamine reductase [Candidatus Uhrbacteria bacterium RIFCSPHIGHO2_02_FULL_60_44]OGL79066.1 MAG: UDP-N-acetylenolpyruvoylglucosamine reductase [Candidatus Uhrbacteria bacterium RIFCSPHIGHO2_12_FULL_60_25]
MKALTPEQIANVVERLPTVIRDEPMSKHTNFRIGGPARLYVVANDTDALVNVVRVARDAGVPWTVFGGGSNILVSDDAYEGLMIQAALRGMNVEGASVTCEPGVITAFAARMSADAGLTGFEWAVGVPGTIGGAVYGNAGCFGGEMKDVIESVDAYRVADDQRLTYTKVDCRFGYRESRFKHEPHLILGCTLRLAVGEKDAARRRMVEIIALRKAKQPLEQSSAGCVFKNFEFSDESALEILRRTLRLRSGQAVEVPAEMLAAKRLSAGWLVDQVGMLGKTVGGVAVSDKHGNFVVNAGGGRAQDVIALMSVIKMKVRDELGIFLEDEVQLVGFE